MDADACEIGSLLEELLSALARTSTRDACHAAAGDSDSGWACFLPRVLPPLAAGELPAAPPGSCP